MAQYFFQGQKKRQYDTVQEKYLLINLKVSKKT